ncbi:hypothetical protein [Roseicella aerolata]|uniref:Uncharacterized protein n=1 Tax=Roseicella aerolata TaxID=2883479 RepID=A0A9X1LAX4_9PROT|nr:hypothetical protein [Roseicella aerolata]MCB4825506.1 hypothetical protein [Roseicella aerolata]
MTTEQDTTGRSAPSRHAPAFDDAALAAAHQQARALWVGESAKERDRLLALPVADRLAALDDEGVRGMLTSEHRAELRASIAAPAAASQASPEDANREHRRAMEEWRARDAQQRADAARLDRERAVVLWGLVPGATVLPSMVAAGIYGWGPMDVVVSLLEVPWLPLVPLGVAVAALAGAGLCGFLASKAAHPAKLWEPVAGAFLAGLMLLGASRSLPLYRAAAGAVASDGRPLAGSVVRLHPIPGGVRMEVLAGNGAFRRGDALVLRDADPLRAIRG